MLKAYSENDRINVRHIMPAKSLGILTSLCKVKLSHPPLPQGIMLVYYCSRGKGAEEVIFFRKRNECYKMQRKLPGVPSTFWQALSEFEFKTY